MVVLNQNSVSLSQARLLLYILLRCTHLGRDWLSMRSAVPGVTFMNEFAPYVMQGPPLKRRTCQRFTEFDYINLVRSLVQHQAWVWRMGQQNSHQDSYGPVAIATVLMLTLKNRLCMSSSTVWLIVCCMVSQVVKRDITFYVYLNDWKISAW